MPLHRLLACVCCLLLGLPLSAALPQPTDEACESFGQHIAGMISAGRPEVVFETVDSIALGERTLRGITLDFPERIGVHTGMAVGLKREMSRQFSGFNAARYLFTRQLGEEKHVYLRLHAPDNNGLCFIALVCIEYAPGKVRWIDLYSHTTGEWLSESIRRVLLSMLAAPGKSRPGGLGAPDQEYLQHIETLQNARRMIAAGDPWGALAILHALPEDIRSRKFALVIRNEAATALGKEEYLALYDDWRRLHPDDPALDMIGIDACVFREDYEGVIKHLDTLNRRLGQPDAYLLWLKGGMLMHLDRHDEARSVAEAANRHEPTLLPVYDMLLALALKREDHADVARVLGVFDRNFPENSIAGLVQDEEAYDGFRQSAEYRAWLASRPGQPGPAPVGSSANGGKRSADEKTSPADAPEAGR